MRRALGYPGRGLHGELVRRIGRDIVTGRLQPGDLITASNEPDVSTASRTVIREVVKVLTAKRLVESRQRVGTRVRPREDWNLLDPDVIAWQLESGERLRCFGEVTELRLLVEPAAAQMAAERATDAEVERMASAYRRMVAAQTTLDPFLAADVDFHQTILKACQNETVEQLAWILRAIFRLSFSFSTRVRDTTVRTLALHENVLVSVQERDPTASADAMRTLITQTSKMVEQGFAMDDQA
jgi:GntR family transcriptional regulator, galactonate operon transcriptional repressor